MTVLEFSVQFHQPFLIRSGDARGSQTWGPMARHPDSPETAQSLPSKEPGSARALIAHAMFQSDFH